MYNIRSLQEGEEEALYDLLAVSFTKGNEEISSVREIQKQIIESEPSFCHELNRVIEVDGKLVARVGVYDRTMLFNKREFRIGAIGGVCTLPEYRGNGLAKALLDDCTEYMQENGFFASMLFGEPAIYGRKGWQVLSSFGISGNLKLPLPSKLRIRHADLKEDIAWLKYIYDDINSDLNGPFRRSKEYWEKWIFRKTVMRKSHNIKIAENKDQKIGYYVLRADNTICEMAWDRNVTNSFNELIGAIFSEAETETVSFNFFMQELFDFICNNSISPELDDMRNKKYYISKDAIYCGLFKLIDKTEIATTEDLISLLRKNNYIFWDIDHF